MLAIKKNPNAKLENYSKLLILLGLVLSLFIVYESFRMKSFPSEIKELTGSYSGYDDIEGNIDNVRVELKTPPPPKVAIPQHIIKVEDDLEIEEQIIESTEIDEKMAVEVEERMEVVDEAIEEEVIVEDVPFVVIEEVPVFPGCKGNKEALRKCFSERVSKFVQKKFDSDLGADLGLQKGIQRIFVMFTIDKYGKVVNVKARAPHKRLQYEAIEVIQQLPQMIPGKQRGVPVGVKYSLPIVFKVE